MARVMSSTAERSLYIDFLKGVCCLFMMAAHAMLIDVVFHGAMPPYALGARYFIYFAQLVVPIFYMASGINALTFHERGARRADFDATRFYLASAALLFVGGYTYSLMIGSAKNGVPDIFQCVAMGTALAFLLVRFRVPTWIMAAFGLAILGVFLAFRVSFSPTAEGFAALSPLQRWAFGHFSFFPWCAFFPLGIVLHRITGRAGRAVVLTILAGLAVAGAFMDGVIPESEFEVMFRVDPKFALTATGLSGMLLMWTPRIYPAAPGRFLRFVELVGRESLLFLIFHALVLAVLLIVFQGRIDYGARALLETAFTCALLPQLVAWRDRRTSSPAFLRNALVALGVFGVIAALAWINGAKALMSLAGAPAAMAFALAFPTLRRRLQTRFVRADV
ncbi:MAG: DUF1624 domain-containing protein [Deltaproteobacteria bacterium]|nr:DUF1624 domain-containing protein [Deltaproteobacteria bacterium]